ncbi:MAG: hypothetical protein AB1847_11530 [bacterium]
MYKKKWLKNILLVFLILFAGFVFCSMAAAQVAPTTTFTTPTTTTTSPNWTALPPYNTLWPLWSAPLSPVDPVTGIPTPIVTNLYRTTVLPVQPGLTWHPSLGHPWLLYNTPIGLAYYDPFLGINKWPPDILQSTITGLPISITLPSGYESLPATPAWWLLGNVPAANWEYVTVYPSFYTSSISSPVAPALSSLLTPSALLL